jgi:hypothetical protein
MRKIAFISLVLVQMAFLSACDNSMRDQAKYQPLEKSDFFADGQASRHLVEGTIPRGGLEIDEHLYTGKVDGKHVDNFPFEITDEILKRGQERYNIYCAVCHDQLGYGNGMVVQRGFTQPKSFHEQRLIDSPEGYFFDVITNGFGKMNGYDYQVKPHDRWAIVAYIRTLQQSQNVDLKDAPKEEQQKLMKQGH